MTAQEAKGRRYWAGDRSYLGFRSGFQEAQAVSQALGCQAELPLLLVNVCDALENHFIFLPAEQRHTCERIRGCLPTWNQVPKSPYCIVITSTEKHMLLSMVQKRRAHGSAEHLPRSVWGGVSGCRYMYMERESSMHLEHEPRF